MITSFYSWCRHVDPGDKHTLDLYLILACTLSLLMIPATSGQITETHINVEYGFDMDEMLQWLTDSGRVDVIWDMCEGGTLSCYCTSLGCYYEVKW